MSMAVALLLAINAETGPTHLKVDGVEPIQLFDKACNGGSVKLDSASVKRISAAELPAGVLKAISAASFAPESPSYPPQIRSTEIRNTIFRLGRKGQVYLVPATTGALAPTNLSEACFVVWKSDDFGPAYNYLIPYIPPSIRSVGVKGFGHAASDDGAYVRTGATWGRWTVLRSELSTGDPLAEAYKKLGAPKK